MTSEGHIFHQELAFYLIEVSSQLIFYFLLRTISINKECLKVHTNSGSQHKLMCIRLSRSWDEPRAKKTNLDMNKYINLSAIKGNQEFASYTLLHITCDLWYIFSPGPFSIPASLLNGPRWRNKMYLTLQKRKRKQGNLVMWHVMFKIADKDHRSSNTGWNPGSDPSSNLGSNPVSKFRYPRPVSRYILTTW